MSDWCSRLLSGVRFDESSTTGRNPISWPGYAPRSAVQFGVGPVAGHDVVACTWDFSVYGGSLGEAEASTFCAAADRAVERRLPLLTIVRTGGTRLQEGVAALVGIPRTALALSDLAAARLPHISVADNPTTGGVWVSIVSQSDLRAGVQSATVGFSGPRVITAMTGEQIPPTANTAESAAAAGLLDAVLAPDELEEWVRRALATTSRGDPVDIGAPTTVEPPTISGWAQVERARTNDRRTGAQLLDVVLDDVVELGSADDTMRAVIGRSAANRPTVGVALAAQRQARPTPHGFALLRRGARLADRLDLDLCTFVDTPGADPLPPSEDGGLAAAIGDAMLALLECTSPTLAVVHGEGGSGGALAATVADRVVITTNGYFTAIAPEGAALALRMSTEAAADNGAVTPAALRRLGFADACISPEPSELRRVVAAHLVELAGHPPRDRLDARRARWQAPLRGRC